MRLDTRHSFQAEITAIPRLGLLNPRPMPPHQLPTRCIKRFCPKVARVKAPTGGYDGYQGLPWQRLPL